LQFFGHFHPVLVHLPIGILLIALWIEWLCRKEKYAHLRPAVTVILFAGALTAILSCISGYFLSLNDEYDADTLGLHKWLGISVALVSSVAYSMKRGFLWPTHFKKIYPVTTIGLLFLIIGTGHLGGTLTHGEGYLTENLPGLGKEDTIQTRKIITNIQEAGAYEDLIAPVMQSKCYNCHGKSKQKGGLRLDQPEMIMKGGKDGKVLVAGDAKRSEIIKRALLPPEDEDHMPPKERKQLTSQEIKLIQWWISTGADFTKKIKDYPPSDSLSVLLSYLQQQDERKNIPDAEVPKTAVSAAAPKLIDSIRQKSVLLLPVANGSNYLSANFVNVTGNVDSILRLLERLQPQLLFLKAGRSNLSDSGLQSITKMTNLIRLNLEHTRVSDTGMKYLSSLSKLQYLNLVGTKVTAKGLMELAKLKALRNLYVYKTQIEKGSWDALKNTLATVTIDTGGYTVPALPTDTIVLKPPKEKNEKPAKKEKKKP
jgi:uncharacterized membrane protein/mono/diheme cytochrome c family protein